MSGGSRRLETVAVRSSAERLAREWDQTGRDPAELYRGTRLGAALDWSADHADELNTAEQDFLDTSRAAAEQVAERDRRANRRLRALLTGAAALLVAAVVGGVVALSQREEAEDAALSADAQRLGAVAVANERLDEAVLLARAGVHLDPTLTTHGNLLTVLTRQPAALGELRGDGWPVTAAAAHGGLVAVADDRGGVAVYDARARRRLWRYPVFTSAQQLQFAPDGGLLAVIAQGYNGPTELYLLEPRTGRLVRSVSLPRFPEEDLYARTLVAFDATGSHVVVQQSDEEFARGGPSLLRRVNARTGAVERSRRIGNAGVAWNLVSTADHRRLFVTVAGDDRTYEIDPETLTVRREWPDGDRSGAVTPDGSAFALGSAEGDVRLLDLETGRSRGFEGSHEIAGEMHMAFAPDGRTLVTAIATEVVVWDVEDAAWERHACLIAGRD